MNDTSPTEEPSPEPEDLAPSSLDALDSSKRSAARVSRRRALVLGLGNATVYVLLAMGVLIGAFGVWYAPDAEPPEAPRTPGAFQVFVPPHSTGALNLSVSEEEYESDGSVDLTVQEENSTLTLPDGTRPIYTIVASLLPLASQPVEVRGMAEIPVSSYCGPIAVCLDGPVKATDLPLEPRGTYSQKAYSFRSDQENQHYIRYHYNDERTLIDRQGSKIALVVPGLSTNEEGRWMLGHFSIAPFPSAAITTTTLSFAPAGDYIIDSGVEPSRESSPFSGEQEWTWQRQGNDAETAIVVDVAHGAAEDEKEHEHEFASGIILGLAGAAIVAAIQEYSNTVRAARRGERG